MRRSANKTGAPGRILRCALWTAAAGALCCGISALLLSKEWLPESAVGAASAVSAGAALFAGALCSASGGEGRKAVRIARYLGAAVLVILTVSAMVSGRLFSRQTAATLLGCLIGCLLAMLFAGLRRGGSGIRRRVYKS